MTIRDVIVAVIYTSHSHIFMGRRQLNKTLYFVATKLGLDLGHEPFFYGPFSVDVSEVLSYAIQDGIIKKIPNEFDEMYEAIHLPSYIDKTTLETISNINCICDNYSKIEIDAASKLLWSYGGNLTKIKNKEKDMVWRMGATLLERAIKLLRELNLAEEV